MDPDKAALLAQRAIREAAEAMAADFQTSENHHPDHVLVPREAFDAMRAALIAAPASAEPVAWRAIWISDRTGQWIYSSEKPSPKFHRSIEPLYAGPEVTP